MPLRNSYYTIVAKTLRRQQEKFCLFSTLNTVAPRNCPIFPSHPRRLPYFDQWYPRWTSCRFSSQDIATASTDFSELQQPTEEEEQLEVRIPGTDSLVIMVSDELVDMVKQNSELIESQYKHRIEDEDYNNDLIEPPPVIMYKDEATYFQFDYRNHPPITDVSMKNLLRKIEASLYRTHLEPYGRDRGVQTMAQNVESFKEGKMFRVGSKSYNKHGTIEPVKKAEVKVNRYSLLRLLKERHTIYATGNHSRLATVDKNIIGKSFFGPESDINVLHKEAELLLRDLWFFGMSQRFNGLQRRHFSMENRKYDKLRRERKLRRLEEQENALRAEEENSTDTKIFEETEYQNFDSVAFDKNDGNDDERWSDSVSNVDETQNTDLIEFSSNEEEENSADTKIFLETESQNFDSVVVDKDDGNDDGRLSDSISYFDEAKNTDLIDSSGNDEDENSTDTKIFLETESQNSDSVAFNKDDGNDDGRLSDSVSYVDDAENPDLIDSNGNDEEENSTDSKIFIATESQNSDSVAFDKDDGTDDGRSSDSVSNVDEAQFTDLIESSSNEEGRVK
jgi:hypothetical protein